MISNLSIAPPPTQFLQLENDLNPNKCHYFVYGIFSEMSLGDISLLFSNDNVDVESVREGHRIEIIKLIFSLYVDNQFSNFRMMV